MIKILCSRIALFSLLFLLFSACKEQGNAKSEGQQLLEQNKLPEAILWYNKQIEEEKSPLELEKLYYGRALVHRKMNNTDKALSDLNWALVIDSTNTTYMAEIGDIYFAKHQTREAEFHYQHIANLEPENGVWPYKIGKCKLLREEYPGAIEDFEKAEKSGYNDSDLFLQMGIAYHRAGMLDKCCAAFKKSAELGNKEAEMFFKNLRCS